MALEIKHVADLMGMNFMVPSYQRGYRWERKQIEQLLDDLLEFQKSIDAAKEKDEDNREWNEDHPNNTRNTENEDKIGYYCLQPLAVTATESGYDIIDGQQRLTTIYLILCYLAQNYRLPFNQATSIEESMYTLTYQTREKDFFTEKRFRNQEADTCLNIDFYFMAKGYETICAWFASNPYADNDILHLLLPTEYRPDNVKKNNRLHDVRFIWYDTPAASSIATFNNLNYGKIGLTASELVKALLLQSDVYDVEIRETAKHDAMTRSTKWSLMEEGLRDEFFWGMLASSDVEKDIHMEMILRFVAQDIDSHMHYSDSEGWRYDDSDWVFNIFCKAIGDNQFKGYGEEQEVRAITERIEFLWNEIQKVYSVLHNWYLNRKLYHMIGLFVHLKTHYEWKDRISVLRELYVSYRYDIQIKDKFEEYLIAEIGKAVKIKSKIKVSEIIDGKEKEVNRLKTIDEINYNDDANDIRRILLLFNVRCVIDDTKENSRFPFHFANKLISLEHIHPQNLDEGNIDYSSFKDWFETRSEILRTSGALENNKPLSEAITRLSDYLRTDTLYNENKAQCHQDLSKVDECFDELAGMNPEIMHTLYNMALVDTPTNSALGNRLIDAKRNILKGRKDESYIPVGTWNAFSKYYSSSIKDMKFWSADDRTAYFEQVKRVYMQYVK